jgi:hypothetical protein
VKTLGFKGVEVSSSVNGLELADTRFWPVWSKAQQLDCFVFIHPLGTSVGERLNKAISRILWVNRWKLPLLFHTSFSAACWMNFPASSCWRLTVAGFCRFTPGGRITHGDLGPTQEPCKGH